MSPWLLLFLACALLLYLFVILPLVRDENPLGRLVVVAPTLHITLKGGHTRKGVVAVVRRWERGWNGTTGEQRGTPDAKGRLTLPPATVRSWAARVVPHEPSTEQFLFVVLREEGQEHVEEEPSWTHMHFSYDDLPLELAITL